MLPEPVKKVFDILTKHPRWIALGCLFMVLVVFSTRLASGPIRVDGLKPIILSRLEAQLPGTRATLGHLDLVWFGDARAVGFRFQDLMLRDSKNRIVARAGRMEAALAADSLILLHFAPARLSAQDFFVAASVSDEGRYELGFDARGNPDKGPAGLERFFYDLTGPETLGRPVTFARQINLKDGELRFMQRGSTLDWTARVATIEFTKIKGKLSARSDLTITAQGAQASMLAQASGLTGLKSASITARINNLVPARVFPSVGVTRYLARIDAPLGGTARVEYSLERGFEDAWVDLDAGAGHVSFADTRHAFDGARIKASYTTSDHTAAFEVLRVRSDLIDADLTGKLVFVPADSKTKRTLRLNYDFSGPRLTGRLADDFAHQTLIDAHVTGTYIPDQRRLEITSGTGTLDGAALSSQGAFFTDAEGRLGADLTATVKGRVGKEAVFAFWPQRISPLTRNELVERIRGGDYTNADFVLKVPPGHFGKDQMQDEDLRLEFDFANAEVKVEDRMAHATGLRGHGTLLGNSFTMRINGGRLADVGLLGGELHAPDFHDKSAKSRVWLETDSTAAAVIAAVDPLADGQLAAAGLTPERLSGRARVRVDIQFPTFGKPDLKRLDVRFKGKVTEAAFTDAALGWDMSQGSLDVAGDLQADRIEVSGPAQVGPYTGQVIYRTHFHSRTQTVDIAGSFDAQAFGGSPRVPVAVTGRFAMGGGKGEGTIDADIFRGAVSWEGEGSRPSQVSIDGVTLAAGMRAQGLPMFKRLKAEIPTRVTLLRGGEIWAGEVEAEALTGDIAYIEGQRPRLVYKADISPEEARELGYGGLPVFSRPRKLTVNISLDDESKEARVKLDDITAFLGWSEVEGSDDIQRRLTMTVRPEDWATLGLPVAFFKPVTPTEVTALWQQRPDYLSGQVRLLGQVFDFDMPSNETILVEDPYSLRVTGHVTADMMRSLGYSQNPVTFAGDAELAFSLYDMPDHPAAVVNMDATQAALGVVSTNWVKPTGEVTQFALSLDEKTQAGTGVHLSRLTGTGPQVHIDGRASFDGEGKLEFADFSDLYLKNFIDAAIKFYDANGSDVVSVQGRELDLRPWMKRTQATGTAGSPDGIERTVTPHPVHLVVDLDEVRMSDLGAFRRVVLDLDWDGANSLAGTGSAMTAEASPVTLAMEPQDGYSLFSIATPDLGAVVRTAFGTSNVWGGKAVIEGAYSDGQVDASLKGKDIRVKQIPVLAQLLTVASLQGVADTLTGEGIAFSEFEFPVRWRGHQVFIKEGWAEGEGLGFSVRGTADLNARTLNVNGTLIPAYRINAIFGDLSSNGLGLLGLRYAVSGNPAAPAVSVDPLSVIVPGFLKVWERDQVQDDPIAALQLPPVKERLARIREESQALSKN